MSKTKYRGFRDRLLAEDPALKAEYDKLGPRFALIDALISARKRAGLTQTALAARMGVRPHVISRLESAEHSPRLDTIVAVADAIECDLEVKFKPRRKSARRDVDPTP